MQGGDQRPLQAREGWAVGLSRKTSWRKAGGGEAALTR